MRNTAVEQQPVNSFGILDASRQVVDKPPFRNLRLHLKIDVSIPSGSETAKGVKEVKGVLSLPNQQAARPAAPQPPNRRMDVCFVQTTRTTPSR